MSKPWWEEEWIREYESVTSRSREASGENGMVAQCATFQDAQGLSAAPDMARALFAAKRALLGDVDPGRVLPLINDAIMKAGIPFDWVPPSEDEA